MNMTQQAHTKGYRNAMEMLVAEEVKRQFPKLPHNLTRHISPVEIETYALNRLPALYASSQRGWQFQQRRGSDELHQAITTAVRQAIAAVQMDPLRLSQPIALQGSDTQQELESAQAALKEVRRLLGKPNLTWQQLIPALKKRLTAQPQAQTTDPAHPQTWRPGTYGRSVAWHRKSEPTDTSDVWSNDWYTR